MNQTSDQRRRVHYRALLLGSVALLVGMIFSVSTPTAHARCGDYVVIGNPLQPTHSQTHLDHSMAVPVSPKSPQPCHGPGCQQSNAFPPVPVSTVITFSPEFVAIPPEGVATFHSHGESRLDDRRWQRADGVIDRVERPPRQAAHNPLGSSRASA